MNVTLFRIQNDVRKVWFLSLACFVIAGFTGFLFRWGMIGNIYGEMSLQNIRHAHSHLMFFCWITPVPMIYITRYVSGFTAKGVKKMAESVKVILGLGFLSYPFFLMYGYRPADLGFAELPASVIISGLVMLAWYRFAWHYVQARKELPARTPGLFYDGAILMLIVSSAGAWGVAVLQFSGIDNPLYSAAMTHFFLSVFTEGWGVLSAIGLMYEYMFTGKDENANNLLVAPILLGVPLLFPFGIDAGLLSPLLLDTARAGAILVGAGLAVNFYRLAKSGQAGIWWWFIVLIFFAAKILLQVSAAITPANFWLGEHGLRIFYLHLMLLGFFTLLYFSAWHTTYLFQNKSGLKLVVVSILLLLSTLVLISGWWPREWMPGSVFEIVALAALLPVIAVLAEIWISLRYTSFRQS